MAVQTYVMRRGVSADGFGTVFPPVPPTAATVTGRGTIYACNARSGESYTISWEKYFPGTKPASLQLDLQGCDGDPNDANAWYQLDTTQDVTANEMRIVVNKKPLFLAVNVIAIGTPNGGVASRIYLG